MVQFPETARAEWQIIADAEGAELALRARLQQDTLVERELEKMRVRHRASIALQQELDADATPVLEMMTMDDYSKNPLSAPADLIEGVLKDNSMMIMLGPSGSGKSTLALQVVHSLSSGTDFLGQSVVPMTGGFGVLSYDMDGAMVYDWMSGFPGLDAKRVSIVNAYKRGNPVGVPDMRSKIAATWRAMGVEVVVLDSFSASFFGHDQNDAASVMAHYRDMKLFALTEVGARALIVIVHSTKGSPHKARGSTVHHDVADTIVAVNEESQAGGARSVEMVKYRAARGQVQMSTVMVGAPDPTTHLVAVDPGAMTLMNMSLPVGSSAAASMFPPLPETNEDPEPDDGDEGDDDL